MTLIGGDVLVTRNPWLGKARGRVEFSDKGFQIQPGQRPRGGGELQFSGGMRQQAGRTACNSGRANRPRQEGLRQMPGSCANGPRCFRTQAQRAYQPQRSCACAGQPALNINPACRTGGWPCPHR